MIEDLLKYLYNYQVSMNYNGKDFDANLQQNLSRLLCGIIFAK